MSNTPSSYTETRLEFLRSVYQQVSVPNYPSKYKTDSYISKNQHTTNTTITSKNKKNKKNTKNIISSSSSIASRRHKSTKQLISDENKRINNILNKQKEEGNNTDNKQLSINVNYFNVNAPPSLKPIKKYCDITGLKGNYILPGNNLRYYNMEIYQIVKQMNQGLDQEYLKLRGDNVILK